MHAFHTAVPRRDPCLWLCSMNPIGLDPTRFTVATTEAGEIAGFGQLTPHTDDISELRSLFVVKEHRCDCHSCQRASYAGFSGACHGWQSDFMQRYVTDRSLMQNLDNMGTPCAAPAVSLSACAKHAVHEQSTLRRSVQRVMQEAWRGGAAGEAARDGT